MINDDLREKLFGNGLVGRMAASAGAYTRPLFSSTRAVSDTKYTVDAPSIASSLLNTP